MAARDLFATFLGFDDRGEAWVIERLRQGDAAAVAEVYDSHHGAVRAFARRLLGEEGAAEDLVHEVFVSLPSAIRRFEGGSSLRTYLIAVAANHARHHVRAAARRRRAMARFAQELAVPATTPEHDAVRGELALALARALDTLPIEQRVAFVLCDVEERTSREAAEITSVPEATVRTRLFHARKKLRAVLEREGVR
jgi:RNA polymerase sigma-70 factor (ECF subfamily)